MGENNELLESIQGGKGKIYFAVRNDDGTYVELQDASVLMNGEFEVVTYEMMQEPLSEESERIFAHMDEKILEFSASIQAEIGMPFAVCREYVEALRNALAQSSMFDDEVFDRLSKMAAAIPKGSPSRSGFKPHRKSWESDKDDPSTFGAYMSKKHRKKRR